MRLVQFLRRTAEGVVFAAPAFSMSGSQAKPTSAPATVDADIARQIARYTPQMEPAYERIVGDFTRSAVLAFDPSSPRIAGPRLASLAQFALWCWQTAGLELDQRLLFQPSVMEFATAMLLMPLHVLRVRDPQTLEPLSADQTAIRAFSQRGRRARDKKTKRELGKFRPDGTEIERYVLEIDADWYPTKSSKTPRESANQKYAPDLEWDASPSWS
jgi:hypothetical protein